MGPVQPEPEVAVKPKRKADCKLDERWRTQERWQATPTPAMPVTPKLIPIVSTADAADAVELVQTSIRRWPAQENVIKDVLRPLGIDTNHGFANVAVENSEVSKQRGTLEKRLARFKQWAESAGKRSQQAKARQCACKPNSISNLGGSLTKLVGIKRCQRSGGEPIRSSARRFKSETRSLTKFSDP
jgi:hypothetical protein